MLKNTAEYYGSIAKFFHWSVAFLVFSMLCVGFSFNFIDDTTQRNSLIYFHKLTGLGILVLMLLRLLWALASVKPLLPKDTVKWQRIAEHFVHFSLYALLIVMPVSGWVMSVASGHVPTLAGISLGLPIPENKSLAMFAFNSHFWLAIGIIVFVFVHVAAALYHHFIKKDNILRRMTWGRSR